MTEWYVRILRVYSYRDRFTDASTTQEGRNALEPSFASRCLDNIEGEDVAAERFVMESVGNIYFGMY